MNYKPIVFILLLVVPLFLSVIPLSYADSPVAGFLACKKLTIDHNDIGEELTDFPVLVYLNSSVITWSNVQDDLDDLRFTVDNATFLSYEIDSYAVNDWALLWVKIPTISTVDDTIFFLFYRNADATSGADPENVWDANYVMVQHLNDATTSTVLDSTSNSHDGTKTGANEPLVTPLGKIDSAQDFDGGDDAITMVDSPSLDIAGPFTLEAYVKPDGVGANTHGIVTKDDASVGEGYGLYHNPEGKLECDFRLDGGAWKSVTSLLPLSTVDWTYCVTSYNNVIGCVYINGVAVNSINAVGAIATNAHPLYLGRFDLAGAFYFDGLIDEVRISDSARSDAWILASYETQRLHLLTISSAESFILHVELGSIAFILAIASLSLVTVVMVGKH